MTHERCRRYRVMGRLTPQEQRHVDEGEMLLRLSWGWLRRDPHSWLACHCRRGPGYVLRLARLAWCVLIVKLLAEPAVERWQ